MAASVRSEPLKFVKKKTRAAFARSSTVPVPKFFVRKNVGISESSKQV